MKKVPMIPVREEWSPGFHQWTTGIDPRVRATDEMRRIIAETVTNLRIIASQEFERAIAPCRYCEPRVIFPATHDLAERLAAYLHSIPGGSMALEQAEQAHRS